MASYKPYDTDLYGNIVQYGTDPYGNRVPYVTDIYGNRVPYVTDIYGNRVPATPNQIAQTPFSHNQFPQATRSQQTATMSIHNGQQIPNQFPLAAQSQQTATMGIHNGQQIPNQFPQAAQSQQTATMGIHNGQQVSNQFPLAAQSQQAATMGIQNGQQLWRQNQFAQTPFGQQIPNHFPQAAQSQQAATMGIQNGQQLLWQNQIARTPFGRQIPYHFPQAARNQQAATMAIQNGQQKQMMDLANEILLGYYKDEAKLKAGKRTKSEDLVDDILSEILDNKRNKGRYSINPRLAGSYKTGVKIESPDEFDYTVNLKLPPSHHVTSSESVNFRYEKDFDRLKSAAKRDLDPERDLDQDRRIKFTRPYFPRKGYRVVILKESEAKQFSDAVIDDVLVPYEVLCYFHKFVEKAVKDMDNDSIDVESYASGPAIKLCIENDKREFDISVDLVPVIKIGEARLILHKYKWPRKETKAWLSKTKIEEVKETEIFLVAKGDKFWRVSFARCEDEILMDLDGTPKRLLQICKMVLKQWKSKYSSGMDSISSYLFKTILLWLCEKWPNDEDWRKEQLAYQYNNFMVEFKTCLEKLSLGEYFLPSNNLLKTVDEAEIRSLLDCVREELKAMNVYGLGFQAMDPMGDAIADLCLSD